MAHRIGRFVELTPPAVEPVTVPEFKRDARFPSSDFDVDLIPLRLSDARMHFESAVGIVTISRPLRLKLDRFPSGVCPIELPLVPIVTVDEVGYIDAAGDAQVVDPADYSLEADYDPPLLYAPNGWPTAAVRPGAVTIEVTAGYGAAASDIPADIKTAIIWIAKDRFFQPGPLSDDTSRKIDSLRWRVVY